MSLADRVLSEKRLTAAEKNNLPNSAFALPKQRKYPVFDKKRAAVAKEYAKRFATKSQEKKIDTKANKKLYGKKAATESVFSRGSLLTEKHMGFAKLERSLAHKKNGPRNPAAVAAAIGRRKLGNKAFEAKALAGRKKSCMSYGEDIDAVAELMTLTDGLVALRNIVVENIKK
jgi:hypothetical protein